MHVTSPKSARGPVSCRASSCIRLEAPSPSEHSFLLKSNERIDPKRRKTASEVEGARGGFYAKMWGCFLETGLLLLEKLREILYRFLEGEV